MRFVVVGAGGLGGYLGALLFRAGHDVHLVARGEHGTAIRRAGLRVREPEGEAIMRIPCAASGHDVDRPDAVLVTVKTYSLESVAEQVAYLAEQGALVVPLLNGVDAVERLGSMGARADRLLAGLAYVTAFRTAPGVIERQGDHRRVVLSPPPGARLDLIEPIAAAFRVAGIHVDVSEDIRGELWRKMAVVCALAALCGPTRSALGPVRKHPVRRSLQDGVVAEVLAVAAASGVPVATGEGEAIHAILDAFPDGFYPSLLHDLETGRPTEIAALSGTVSRLGRLHSVPTPINDLTTLAVQVGESGRGTARQP